MAKLPKPPAGLSVSVADDTVVAGHPLEVTVRCVAERPLPVSGGEIELVRASAVTHSRHQGMGAGGPVSVRESAAAACVDLDAAGPLSPGQRLVRRATLPVPPGEATIAGHLVQQEYEVRARIHIAGGRPAQAVTALRVAADGAGRRWATEAVPVVDDAGFAALGIEQLRTRRLCPGVPITGVVTVTPRQTGRARGVRMELVLDEHVPPRAEEQVEAERSARSVIAAVSLVQHLDLEPGRVLRLPFTLRAPLPLPAPSISTPEFTVRWLLRAVLDRPLRPDPTTTVELWGTTAPDASGSEG